VRVVLNTEMPSEILNLEEVSLFDAGGAQLRRESLAFEMSSEWDSRNGAANCNDGLWGAAASPLNSPVDLHCHSKPLALDPMPWLSISYPCVPALGSVVVHNRRDPEFIARLTHFLLQHWVEGRLVQQEAFASIQPAYAFNMTAPGEPLAGGSAARARPQQRGRLAQQLGAAPSCGQPVFTTPAAEGQDLRP
jgi:hypothetical protein